MGWLLKDRRRAEVATFIFVMILSSMGFFWLFVGDSIETSVDEAKTDMTIAEFNEKLPAWTLVIPSELYGRAVGGALEGNGIEGAMALTLLLLEVALLFFLSAYAHGRALTASSTTRARGLRWSGPTRALSIPGLSPGTLLVALTQVRVALRTVRGKLAVYPTGPMVLVSGWVLATVFSRNIPMAGMFRVEGHLFLWFAALIVFLSLQPILMNQFATDKAGLTMQFLAPLTDREIVLGKAVAGGILSSISIGLVLIAMLILAPAGSPFSWAASLVGCASIYIMLVPFAALASATFPKPADLSKMGKAGNPHGMAAFMGFVMTLALATPPSILTMIGLLFRSPFLALLLNLGWAAVSLLVAWPLLNVAARQLGNRRENLALVAQGR